MQLLKEASTEPSSDGYERCLGNYNSALKENIPLYKGCCIATFIVPEGAEYFENKYGHIVSSEIIYTGKYLRISNFSK